MVNLKDIEMIGKKVFIENSSDKNKNGLSGLVIFETKNMVFIKSEKNKILKIKKKEILKIKNIL